MEREKFGSTLLQAAEIGFPSIPISWVDLVSKDDIFHRKVVKVV